VLTATFNSNGDRQISTPHKIDTPEAIDKKLGTVDVHETTPIPNLVQIHTLGASGQNITKIIFIYLYLFLRFAYRSDLLMDFNV